MWLINYEVIMKIENVKFESPIMAILPDRINDVIALRAETIVECDNVAEAVQRRATKFKNIKKAVVTVPLHGYISHKPTIWSACGCGIETSSETFANWITDLVANKDVGAIIIDVDSPGGTVMGLSGVVDKIREVKGKKPIIAVVNDLMASAAYWIGSVADEIVSDPDALTGSIGTIGVHADFSEALKQAGIDVTIIKAGQFKDEGSPFKPLTEEAKANQQAMIDRYYNVFVASVAQNRGVSAAKIKSDFGQGRVFNAEKAKAVGMIDRIATMEQVVNDLRPAGKTTSRARAELDLLKSR